jgi:type VI protein secretion system component VasF
MPRSTSFREDHSARSGKTMVDALATLQNLTAQLEALSQQLKCIHDPEQRQALLKQFRSVLDHTDELIAQEFLPRSDASDAAGSSG